MLIPIENPTIKNGRCSEISQYWGENVDYYLKNFKIGGHNGLDFAHLNLDFLPAHDSPSYGRPIIAPCDMRITKIIFWGEHNTKGNGIYAIGDRCELVFWHNRANLVEVGQSVGRGAKIAEMGNSGAVWPAPNPNDPNDHSGTHLHFALRPVDNNGKIKYPNNGFDGYVDPLPFLELKNMYKEFVTKEKLNQIYNELLFREPDENSIDYLGRPEEEVRKAVGESEERRRLIALIGAARKL